MLDCKNQILSTLKNNNCCSLAFLNVVLLTSSQINKEKSNILLNIDNSLMPKVEQILLNFYPDLEIDCWDSFLLIKGNIYSLLSGINYEETLNLDFYPNECDRITILKSLFLLNGHFYYNADNSQNSKGYNLEFTFRTEDLANTCKNLLTEFGFELKKIKRQTSYVLYTKNSNTICDLLVFLGASYASLEMQNNLAMRELRNNVNRQNNCFEFNLDKTIKTSNLQLTAINYIIDNYSIDYFDDNLKEVALARIANPDISLGDLKAVLNNKLSRAGIKYRLDKIIEMYTKLKGE